MLLPKRFQDAPFSALGPAIRAGVEKVDPIAAFETGNHGIIPAPSVSPTAGYLIAEADCRQVTTMSADELIADLLSVDHAKGAGFIELSGNSREFKGAAQAINTAIHEQEQVQAAAPSTVTFKVGDRVRPVYRQASWKEAEITRLEELNDGRVRCWGTFSGDGDSNTWVTSTSLELVPQQDVSPEVREPVMWVSRLSGSLYRLTNADGGAETSYDEGQTWVRTPSEWRRRDFDTANFEPIYAP